MKKLKSSFDTYSERHENNENKRLRLEKPSSRLIYLKPQLEFHQDWNMTTGATSICIGCLSSAFDDFGGK
jgi:hypothetical protein